MRLTQKAKEFKDEKVYLMPVDDELRALDKLGQLEDIEEEYCIYGNEDLCRRLDLADKYGELSEQLGIDLITFLKGIDPNTCFMEITEDKQFYLCGDAYYGNYSKEELLKLIQELLFMYWKFTKEKVANER